MAAYTLNVAELSQNARGYLLVADSATHPLPPRSAGLAAAWLATAYLLDEKLRTLAYLADGHHI